MHPIPNATLHAVVPSQKADVIMCRCKRNIEEGTMVICEECDTWQHVICYYPNELVPAVHFCEVCGSKYYEVKQAAKRQKLMANSDSQATEALPNVVATLGEPEASSDDEPLISILSRKSSSGVTRALRDIKPESAVAPLTGGCQQAMSEAISSKPVFIDLTDEREIDAVKIKTEPGDKDSCRDAQTLPWQFMTPRVSAADNQSKFKPPNYRMAPTTKPNMTPQSNRSARSPLPGAGGTQMINDATTIVFLDGQNREVRRRTFEDLGGRFNVGVLFAQAIRADLIDKFDESAILSVSIRGISDEFKIPKYDKPDFARFRQRVEDIGLCMLDVRRD